MIALLEFLFDTDTCIYLLNGNERVKARVAQVGVGAIAVAIPTVAELYFGAYNSARAPENLARVRAFITPPGPTVLPVDDAAADYFGRFKAELRRDGRPMGDMDLLIAGVAASRGLTVVTNNTSHFERIAGITVTNWLNPTASP